MTVHPGPRSRSEARAAGATADLVTSLDPADPLSLVRHVMGPEDAENHLRSEPSGTGWSQGANLAFDEVDLESKAGLGCQTFELTEGRPTDAVGTVVPVEKAHHPIPHLD